MKLKVGGRLNCTPPPSKTPAAVPLAPLILKSTKLPAATATLPVTVQLPPEAAWQLNRRIGQTAWRPIPQRKFRYHII